MNTHADKTQENKSQSVANELSQKQGSGESTFQFVDNRPEAVAQRKLQEMANNHSAQQQQPIRAQRRGILEAGSDKSIMAQTQTVVQRAIAASNDSHQDLKRIYDELLATPSVGALTDLIGEPIIVRYGREDEDMGERMAFWLIDTRTIVINQDLEGDLPSIRHYILIELNHARLPNGPVAAEQPEIAGVQDEEDLQMYTRALDALRVEYHEWISAYMTNMETIEANIVLGEEVEDNIDYTDLIEIDRDEESEGEGIQWVEQDEVEQEEELEEVVLTRLAQAYKVLGEGFFSFDVYLRMNVESGHTAQYDKTATNEDWVGFMLFNRVEEGLVLIDEEEHDNNNLLMLQNPANWVATLTGRQNPFAGAPGTQLLEAQLIADSQAL